MKAIHEFHPDHVGSTVWWRNPGVVITALSECTPG